MSNEVSRAAGSHNTTTSDPVDDAIGKAEDAAAEYKKIAEDGEKTGSEDMTYYLKLQRAMMQEQQAYTAVSNIIKARADSALTAIRNFK